MARGKVVDRAMVDLVLQMKARNEKLTTEQIGAVVQCDSTTAGRIIRCGSWEAFCAWKDEKARKEREKNRKAAPAEEKPQAEEQVPGQICMELEPKQEMSEQTKLMRFMAGNYDAIRKNQAELFAYCTDICIKMDTLNDTLHMILRAVRKE